MVTIRKTLPVLAAGLALLAASGREASAQSNAGTNLCDGNVFVNSIYTNGVGQNRFEYFIQVQNRSQQMRTFTLNFSGMPQDVTLEGNPRRGSILQPFEQVTIRFGTGTQTNNLTLGIMGVTYDRLTLGGRAAVRVSDCIRAAT